MQVQDFSDLPISEDVLRGIRDLGFKNPTPIQAQSILPLLEGKDVIGQAQTGTGKTAAFGIPMVQSIDLLLRRPQGLVLAPTRELASQLFLSQASVKRSVSGIFEKLGVRNRSEAVSEAYKRKLI